MQLVLPEITKRSVYINRLLARVEYEVSDPGTCWLWQGAKRNRDGYGAIRYEGKPEYVHRVAFVIFKNQPLKDRELVMHLCNTPGCIRPKHLQRGNHSTNQIHRHRGKTYGGYARSLAIAA